LHWPGFLEYCFTCYITNLRKTKDVNISHILGFLGGGSIITKCGYKTNPDIQASQTILKRGLESFGIGTTPMDLKQKTFCSTSLEVAETV
jgi:heterodisulfide reductase subunit C